MLEIDGSGMPKSPYRRGLTYPPYAPRTGEKRRKRVFAWMTVSHKNNSIEVLDEHGRRFRFGICEYEAVRDTAVAERWTLFSRFECGIANRFPFLKQALHDGCATILASTRGVTRRASVCGVEWRRGNKRSKVVDPDAWGVSQLVREGVHVSPITFLLYCRKLCNLVGVGDMDTPSAIGAAKLAQTWHDIGLRKLWLLPSHLRDLLESNPTHPRIYDVATPARYDLLRERDRRSAYATALGGNLPLAQPAYVSASEATPDVVRGTTQNIRPSTTVSETGICFGEWEVTVPKAIAYGPVCRVWSPGKSPSLHLEQGVFTIPAWGEEADALAEVGCSCIWKGGYLWLEVGAPWKGMVDEITRLRKWADETGRPILSEMLKRLPNGTVGRFHCLQRGEIIEASRAGEDDWLFPLDWNGRDVPADDDENLAALHITESNDCLPQHWYSYIVMKIGLDIWRAEREEIRKGHTVVSANIDSYRVITYASDIAPPFNPLEWKELVIRDVRIDASRHIDGWKSSDGGQTWQRMIRAPGVRRE